MCWQQRSQTDLLQQLSYEGMFWSQRREKQTWQQMLGNLSKIDILIMESGQMAGHPGKITFTNEVVVKKATNDEIWAYSNLIPLGLAKFAPNLISYTETSIEIENLMSGTDPNHVRIVDIKLGTSTCTKNAK
jgi:hypothetical protein